MNINWNGYKLEEVYAGDITDKAGKYYFDQDVDTAMQCSYFADDDIHLKNRLYKYFLVDNHTRQITQEFNSLEELNNALECIADEILSEDE